MRILSAALLMLMFCGFAAAQKMTDREFADLNGKVKTVENWSQKVGQDGNPVEQAKTDSQTTFDQDGNRTDSTMFGPGQFHTSYFLHEGERVSRSEFIGPDPSETVKLPKGVKLRKKRPSPFDHKYKYKYDQKGRITEVSWRDTERLLSSSDRFVYDDAGRKISETVADGGIAGVTTYKYNDSGHLIEEISDRTIRFLKGTRDNFPGGPYVAIEKHTSTIHYSDHVFDKEGNWTKRTATELYDNGRVKSIILQVRYFTYF